MNKLIIFGLSFYGTCLLATVSQPAGAEEIDQDWQKIREANGVVVYTSVGDRSGLIMVKAEVLINVAMDKVKSMIDDTSYRKKWVPYLVESRLLESYSSTERLEYSLFGSPPYASDRDFLCRQQLLYSDSEKMVFRMRSMTSDLMPEQDGIIRAELIESQYTLTAINNNQTYVELIFSADPKGWLPGWIVNIIQERLPYMMLRNLRNLIERQPG